MPDLDTTLHAQREIKYAKCIIKHSNLIRAELQFRRVIVDGKNKDNGVKIHVEAKQHGETSSGDSTNNKYTC